MAQYYCSFNGHFLKDKRPDGWPLVVKDEFVYQADSPKALADYLNGRAAIVQKNGGLNVIKDKAITEGESNGAFNEGAFIPMHMFAFVDYTVKQLNVDIPDVEDPGLIKQ